MDWVKILKGAGYAAAGAAMTYLSEAAAGGSFGMYGPLVQASLSVLALYVAKQVAALSQS